MNELNYKVNMKTEQYDLDDYREDFIKNKIDERMQEFVGLFSGYLNNLIDRSIELGFSKDKEANELFFDLAFLCELDDKMSELDKQQINKE